MMIKLNDAYLRLLTEEEIKSLPTSLDPHPLLENRAHTSTSDRALLADDIKRNGMTKPIVIHNSLLLDTEEGEPEYREIVIVEGYKRYIAAVHTARISKNKLPFAEFMGTDEELKIWLRRERDIRSHEDTKSKVIMAIDITIPELVENKEWKKHSLFDAKTMKGRDDLAAKINGTSRGNIHKGMKIRETSKNLYAVMKITDITLEEAHKILTPKTWKKEWIEKILEKLYANPHPITKELRKMLEKELELVEDTKKTPQTIFQDAPVEACKAKGKLIVQMDKIQSESNVEFQKRAEGFANALSSLANQWGITNVHVITGSIGKTLIDEALSKTLEVDGAMIKTISVEQQEVELIPEEELDNYKVEQIEPDKKVEKKYQQYIGGKSRI